MKKSMFKYMIDLSNPPALTGKQKVELAALKEKPDSEIDYSDIPPLDDAFWKKCSPQSFLQAD